MHALTAPPARRRCHELLSSEATLCSDLETLIEQLGLLSRDKRWKLRPEHVSLIESTTASAQRVAKVHAGLREKMALFVAAPWQLSHAFRGCADVMVAAHADFQTHCTAVMVVLQKRAGGQVVGDRAVGTASKEEGTLASDLAALQDLLVRPAQRIMKLGLFMDDMAADARQAQRAQEAEGLLESAEVVRGIVTEINGRIRSAQKSQRVRLIAARVRGVPANVRLAEPSSSREFVLDDGSFRERHRAGYRHLYLFSDALLVCKPGENLLGRMGWSHTASEQDLKFKRLIPLAGLEPSDLPWVSEPACSSCSPVTADTPPSPTPESPGSVQALPFFELPDGAGARVAFHHVDRAKVVEWVQAITEVVHKSWETAETHAMTQRAGLQARAPAPSRPPCRRGDDVEKETALTLDGKRLSQYALLTRARTDQHEPRSPASSRIVAGSTRRGGEGTAAHAPTAASIFYF